MTTLFVKELTVIDFSYIHNERGLIGESWILDVSLTGKLNEIGFIFDFGKVKKAIKTTVDNHMDHKCLVARQSPHIIIESKNNYEKVTYKNNYQVILESPKSSLTFIDDQAITKENCIAYLKSILIEVLPKNITSIELTLRDEIIEGSFYHYSHGLKKHDGNCQRIAHGHRSRIEIFSNGIRQLELENHWANKLKDSYVGTTEDILSRSTIDSIHYINFGYISAQGEFKLQIPEEKCILVETESSVENIAEYIATESLKISEIKPLTIQAYEGVGKGAIFEII